MALSYPPLIKEGLVSMALESGIAGYGADPGLDPSVTGCVAAFDVELDPDDNVIDSLEEAVRPYAGSNFTVVGGQKVPFSFKVPMAGDGQSGGGGTDIDLPMWNAALLASKMSRTDTGTPITSRAWTPATQGVNGCTFHVHYYKADTGANEYKIIGWNGQVSFVYDPATKPYAFMEFAGTGFYAVPNVVATVVPPYYAETPPACKGIVCTFGGQTLNIRKFRITLPTEVNSSPGINPSTGYIYHLATRSGSATWEMTTDQIAEDSIAPGEYPFYEFRDDAEEQTVTIGPMGSGTGNTFTLSMPKAITHNLSHGMDGGIRVHEMSGTTHWTNGDDDITFTLE